MSIIERNIIERNIVEQNIVERNTIEQGEAVDVLILGAGLAGISVALSLPKHLKVMVLSKDMLTECSSHYAQGGIAASIAADDSVDNHVRDTLVAGDGLCDVTASTHILSEGRSAIQWLYDQAVAFTFDNDLKTALKTDLKTDTLSQSVNDAIMNDMAIHDAPNKTLHNTLQHTLQGKLHDKLNNTSIDHLHLTKEGGHSHRRVIHADDATGKHIMTALWQELKQHDNVQVLTHHEGIELTTQPAQFAQPASQPTTQQSVLSTPRDFDQNNVAHKNMAHTKPSNQTNQTCTGAWILNRHTQQIRHIRASAVVLATGGLGRLFQRATAPHIAMGDGVMMAWEAGCRLANLEFVQFHPTGLAVEGSSFLISEAVRGEGGLLKCPLTGKRFMPKYDERAELAPRDVVARAIYQEIQTNGQGYVHLDISHLDVHLVQQHFPTIYKECLKHGIDISHSPIPVAPTAHYSCGGVLATTQGVTDVDHLYAVGEVAYTGLHGANRLASNSLLECVVVGRQVAEHIAESCVAERDLTTDSTASSLSTASLLLTAYSPNVSYPVDVSYKSVIHELCAVESPSHLPSQRYAQEYKTSYVNRLHELKALMSGRMGIVRDEHQLADAIRQVKAWLKEARKQQPAHIGKLTNKTTHKITNKVTQANVGNIDSTASDVSSDCGFNTESNTGAGADCGYADSAEPISQQIDLDNLRQMRWLRLLKLSLLMLHSAEQRTESRGGHYRYDYKNSHDISYLSIIDSV